MTDRSRFARSAKSGFVMQVKRKRKIKWQHQIKRYTHMEKTAIKQRKPKRPYKCLTWQQRLQLEAYLKAKTPKKEIAERDARLF